MSKSKRKYPRSSAPYPRNWGKAAQVLRRVVGHCEMCGSEKDLTIHHLGIPFADGRPNSPTNKHDLRRENLQVLCSACHDLIEPCRLWIREQKEKRLRRRDRHRALGVGTGLVLYPLYPCLQAAITHI